MGTNYYLRYNICDCCNRYDELHIGKSSGGWQFLFHSVDEYIFPKTLDPKSALLDQEETHVVISSFQHWKKFIQQYVVEYQTAKIYDEYDLEVSATQFFSLIDSKTEQLSHYKRVSDSSCFLDPEGHSFIKGEFS